MPDWTGTQGPFTPPAEPIYPQDNGNTVRQWANYLNYQSAIDTLNEIKNDLFGNADQVDSLAYGWAQNQVMNNDQTNIQAATNNLAEAGVRAVHDVHLGGDGHTGPEPAGHGQHR